MASNLNIEKNSLPFLFNEDIYSIAEKSTPNSTIEKQKTIEHVLNTPNSEIKKEPIVQNKDYAVILSNQQEFDSGVELLKKILGAIKLDINNVDLLFSNNIQNDLVNTSQHKNIISFGLDPIKYQLNFYTVTKKNNSVMLFSHSLSELDKDIQKKKALWAALQQLL